MRQAGSDSVYAAELDEDVDRCTWTGLKKGYTRRGRIYGVKEVHDDARTFLRRRGARCTVTTDSVDAFDALDPTHTMVVDVQDAYQKTCYGHCLSALSWTTTALCVYLIVAIPAAHYYHCWH